jgi:hypothetical protein
MTNTQQPGRSVSQMIKTDARSKGVRQDIIEKDYALSYLLAAIAATDGMGDHLVLKGGSALKKLYFEKYRFSEDLDYSTEVIGPLREADSLMQAVIRQMNLTLNERGPFQVSFEPLILPQTHPGDQKAYIVRVRFPDQRQPLCRLKVEITTDEPIIVPVEIRPVIHGFPEEFQVNVPVYALTEIAAEKLRALLQSRERLQERGWGASRVCRDYYDLWYLLQQPVVNSADLIPLIREKCAVRNVSFATLHDFIPEDLLEVARSEWTQQLLPFVPDAPPAADLLNQVQFMILSVIK